MARVLAPRHGVGLAALAVAALIWGLLHWFAPGFSDALDERSSDLAWRWTAQRADERRVLIVDIDERSLQEIGPWPWPRTTQARLIERLAQAGVALQVYDIVFAEAGAQDEALANAIQWHRPVLSQLFALEHQMTRAGRLAGALDGMGCPVPFVEAGGYLANQAAFLPPGIGVGHITPSLAQDGIVRRQPAAICFDGQAYPALGLAAMARGADGAGWLLRKGSGWLDAPWSLVDTRQALPPVPLDAQGDLRVPWHLHPDSFISIPAVDVLNGRLPPGLLNQAWVLVGSSAFGLNDVIATPFSPNAAGVQVHAQLLVGLMEGRLPYQPRNALWLQIAGALSGLGLLWWLAAGQSTRGHGVLRGRSLPVYLLPLAALGWAILLCLLHGLLLVWAQLWIGWVQPALAVLAAGMAWGILEHARSRIDRDRLYSHLSSYLPAPVAAALALQPPSSAIKAETRQVSVLFADIRNFSAYCEARPPEEAAAVLHAFFSTATRVVQAHGGMIEAFQGDAILAVWNGTRQAESQPDTADHSRHALRAAIALLKAMDGVLPDPAPAGLEPLALGIGVESGPATTGSFGLASRRTHMVMGRTVTIASRLVGMTADLSHPILVGEGLAANLGGAGLESMGTFLLDGMRVPHHVYACPLFSEPRLA